MVRIGILIALVILFISSCNEFKDAKMKAQTTEDKNLTRDSISDYALVNGIQMYYEIHGTGSPLVLIHGGGSTIGTTFGRVLHLFALNHKVIAVELQSHGHTADHDRPYSFEQDADDVAALLKYLKIEKADIFGFSNGGNVTMQIAIRHPELVRKIIVGSSFFKRDGLYPQLWEFMSQASLDNMP